MKKHYQLLEVANLQDSPFTVEDCVNAINTFMNCVPDNYTGSLHGNTITFVKFSEGKVYVKTLLCNYDEDWEVYFAKAMVLECPTAVVSISNVESSVMGEICEHGVSKNPLPAKNVTHLVLSK